MNTKKKNFNAAIGLWSFGTPLVVSAFMTKLDPDFQFWLPFSLGLILMIASYFACPKD